jgi:hypothetical protein
VDEDTARKKDELALQLAMGEITVLQSEDVFEGLTPQVQSKLPEYSRDSLSGVCIGICSHILPIAAMNSSPD